MDKSYTIAVRLIVGLFSLIAAGCSSNVMSTIYPGTFGEEVAIGQKAEDVRKVVYGHVFIDIPSTYSNLGTVEVAWQPSVPIPDLTVPQYLSTTVYAYNGTYYFTQWTRLGSDKYYFEPLVNEDVERWGTTWQLTTFTVPADTANSEYSQYFNFLQQQDEELSDSFAINVYAKRFSGRVIIRVLELRPATGASVLVPQFPELYPVRTYRTVE
ncbi:hypothetical protein [Halodesulfovibrio spirochaetisodalis]|uniref:Lipoprotein n=1 Tax=Halodesulfovibrio spirochaetisodalis TaxID=1560234 RepID=A0A1B7XE26_9BACT|nr:hypothetical protein [Halodesulfovibrio spirochaetisodalis]OBQ52406.1 hypothetical protein SP90_07465 [Halodesulfovibrio spirochaetisodalis]